LRCGLASVRRRMAVGRVGVGMCASCRRYPGQKVESTRPLSATVCMRCGPRATISFPPLKLRETRYQNRPPRSFIVQAEAGGRERDAWVVAGVGERAAYSPGSLNGAEHGAEREAGRAVGGNLIEARIRRHLFWNSRKYLRAFLRGERGSFRAGATRRTVRSQPRDRRTEQGAG